jgi:hypothetical protein
MTMPDDPSSDPSTDTSAEDGDVQIIEIDSDSDD